MSERTDLVLNETVEQLDKILAALTPPTPPPPDPFADPTKTVGILANGDIIEFTGSKILYDPEEIAFDIEIGREFYASVNGAAPTTLTESQINSVKALRIGTEYYPSLSALLNLESSTYEWLMSENGALFPNLTDLSMGVNDNTTFNSIPSISAITFMVPTNLYTIYDLGDLKKIKVMSDLSVIGMSSPHIDQCYSLESFELPQTGTLKIIKDSSIHQWASTFGDDVSLTAMTVPAGLNVEFCDVSFARSIVELTMEGRTMAEVQGMTGYPFGVGYIDGGTIHCSDGDIEVPPA